MEVVRGGNGIAATVKDSEKLSVDKQAAIRNIADGAAKKMQEIVDTDDKQKVDDIVTKGWKDL